MTREQLKYEILERLSMLVVGIGIAVLGLISPRLATRHLITGVHAYTAENDKTVK